MLFLAEKLVVGVAVGGAAALVVALNVVVSALAFAVVLAAVVHGPCHGGPGTLQCLVDGVGVVVVGAARARASTRAAIM